jgi:hypothetical protein
MLGDREMDDAALLVGLACILPLWLTLTDSRRTHSSLDATIVRIPRIFGSMRHFCPLLAAETITFARGVSSGPGHEFLWDPFHVT